MSCQSKCSIFKITVESCCSKKNELQNKLYKLVQQYAKLEANSV